MRKVITLVFLGAALAVPAATAATTKGKPTGPKPCHGKAEVMVVLKGTLANDPAAGDPSFQLTVLHTNRWGRGYKQATQPVTINVTDVNEAPTLTATGTPISAGGGFMRLRSVLWTQPYSMADWLVHGVASTGA